MVVCAIDFTSFELFELVVLVVELPFLEAVQRWLLTSFCPQTDSIKARKSSKFKFKRHL